MRTMKYAFRNPLIADGEPSAMDDVQIEATQSSPLVNLLSMAAQAALIYHGYKRNHSVWWALGWGFVPWPIGIPIALAQGFAKRSSR